MILSDTVPIKYVTQQSFLSNDPGDRAGSGTENGPDILGGSFGAIGILAALQQRQATGSGSLVQASLFEDPHLTASDGRAETLPPDGRTGKLPRLPLRLDGRALPLRCHPPSIGNGTRELLRTIGLDDVEIESLLSDQIVPA